MAVKEEGTDGNAPLADISFPLSFPAIGASGKFTMGSQYQFTSVSSSLIPPACRHWEHVHCFIFHIVISRFNQHHPGIPLSGYTTAVIFRRSSFAFRIRRIRGSSKLSSEESRSS